MTADFTFSDASQMFEELMVLKDQYDRLVRDRIEDISVEEEYRKMPTKEFLVKARELEKKCDQMKRDLNRLAEGEVTICNVCGKFFPHVPNKYQDKILECEGHKNFEPIQL